MTIKEKIEVLEKNLSETNKKAIKIFDGNYFLNISRVDGLSELARNVSINTHSYRINIGFEIEDNGLNENPEYKEYVGTSFDTYNGDLIVDSRTLSIDKSKKTIIFKLIDKALSSLVQ